jgi:hypothetical protein
MNIKLIKINILVVSFSTFGKLELDKNGIKFSPVIASMDMRSIFIFEFTATFSGVISTLI